MTSLVRALETGTSHPNTLPWLVFTILVLYFGYHARPVLEAEGLPWSRE